MEYFFYFFIVYLQDNVLYQCSIDSKSFEQSNLEKVVLLSKIKAVQNFCNQSFKLISY